MSADSGEHCRDCGSSDIGCVRCERLACARLAASMASGLQHQEAKDLALAIVAAIKARP